MAHAGPDPQLQTPPVQRSAVVGSHAVHAAPPAPHAPSEGELQLLPEQQPVVQVIAQPLHTPPVHVCPPGQDWQVDPPLPHATAELPASQVAPLQQPDGQVVASQTHAPERHRWPDPHGAPDPHMHAPAAEQLSAATGSHAAHAAPGPAHVAAASGVHIEP